MRSLKTANTKTRETAYKSVCRPIPSPDSPIQSVRAHLQQGFLNPCLQFHGFFLLEKVSEQKCQHLIDLTGLMVFFKD